MSSGVQSPLPPEEYRRLVCEAAQGKPPAGPQLETVLVRFRRSEGHFATDSANLARRLKAQNSLSELGDRRKELATLQEQERAAWRGYENVVAETRRQIAKAKQVHAQAEAAVRAAAYALGQQEDAARNVLVETSDKSATGRARRMQLEAADLRAQAEECRIRANRVLAGAGEQTSGVAGEDARELHAEADRLLAEAIGLDAKVVDLEELPFDAEAGMAWAA